MEIYESDDKNSGPACIVQRILEYPIANTATRFISSEMGTLFPDISITPPKEGSALQEITLLAGEAVIFTPDGNVYMSTEATLKDDVFALGGPSAISHLIVLVKETGRVVVSDNQANRRFITKPGEVFCTDQLRINGHSERITAVLGHSLEHARDIHMSLLEAGHEHNRRKATRNN